MIYDIEGRAYAKLVDPDGAGFERLPFAWEFPHNVLECAYDLLQRKCRDDDAQVVRLNAVLPPCACPFPDARRRPDLVAVGTEVATEDAIDVHNRRYRGPDRATTPPPSPTKRGRSSRSGAWSRWPRTRTSTARSCDATGAATTAHASSCTACREGRRRARTCTA